MVTGGLGQRKVWMRQKGFVLFVSLFVYLLFVPSLGFNDYQHSELDDKDHVTWRLA